jgi:hypothetical protein
LHRAGRSDNGGAVLQRVNHSITFALARRDRYTGARVGFGGGY